MSDHGRDDCSSVSFRLIVSSAVPPDEWIIVRRNGIKHVTTWSPVFSCKSTARRRAGVSRCIRHNSISPGSSLAFPCYNEAMYRHGQSPLSSLRLRSNLLGKFLSLHSTEFKSSNFANQSQQDQSPMHDLYFEACNVFRLMCYIILATNDCYSDIDSHSDPYSQSRGMISERNLVREVRSGHEFADMLNISWTQIKGKKKSVEPRDSNIPRYHVFTIGFSLGKVANVQPALPITSISLS